MENSVFCSVYKLSITFHELVDYLQLFQSLY